MPQGHTSHGFKICSNALITYRMLWLETPGELLKLGALRQAMPCPVDTLQDEDPVLALCPEHSVLVSALPSQRIEPPATGCRLVTSDTILEVSLHGLAGCRLATSGTI